MRMQNPSEVTPTAAFRISLELQSSVTQFRGWRLGGQAEGPASRSFGMFLQGLDYACDILLAMFSTLLINDKPKTRGIAAPASHNLRGPAIWIGGSAVTRATKPRPSSRSSICP